MSLLARVKPTFVDIPAGTFEMGSWKWTSALPIETREMSAFKMMDAHVTFAQWKAYVDWGEANNISHARFIYGPDGRIARTIFGPSQEALQSKEVSLKAGQFVGDIQSVVPTWEKYVAIYNEIFRGTRHFLSGNSLETCNRPAILIDWFEAAAFCAAIGCELPTEAQHEYAARAGRKGDDIYGTDSGGLTAENAHWKHDGSIKVTADVRSYPPNPWGLYDMAGNVEEWCLNWFSENYQGWVKKDPTGPLVGRYRAVRGGVSNDRGVEHAASRVYEDPHDGVGCIGFRAVRRLG